MTIETTLIRVEDPNKPLRELEEVVKDVLKIKELLQPVLKHEADKLASDAAQQSYNQLADLLMVISDNISIPEAGDDVRGDEIGAPAEETYEKNDASVAIEAKSQPVDENPSRYQIIAWLKELTTFLPDAKKRMLDLVYNSPAVPVQFNRVGAIESFGELVNIVIRLDKKYGVVASPLELDAASTQEGLLPVQISGDGMRPGGSAQGGTKLLDSRRIEKLTTQPARSGPESKQPETHLQMAIQRVLDDWPTITNQPEWQRIQGSFPGLREALENIQTDPYEVCNVRILDVNGMPVVYSSSAQSIGEQIRRFISSYFPDSQKQLFTALAHSSPDQSREFGPVVLQVMTELKDTDDLIRFTDHLAKNNYSDLVEMANDLYVHFGQAIIGRVKNQNGKLEPMTGARLAQVLLDIDHIYKSPGDHVPNPPTNNSVRHSDRIHSKPNNETFRQRAITNFYLSQRLPQEAPLLKVKVARLIQGKTTPSDFAENISPTN